MLVSCLFTTFYLIMILASIKSDRYSSMPWHRNIYLASSLLVFPGLPSLLSHCYITHSSSPIHITLTRPKSKNLLEWESSFFLGFLMPELLVTLTLLVLTKDGCLQLRFIFFFSVLILACSCKVLNMLICDQVCENVITQLHIN